MVFLPCWEDCSVYPWEIYKPFRSSDASCLAFPPLISASFENFPASSLPFPPVLWSHCFGPCIISFLEPIVWSQSGLSASLGSANKLGSEGHTAGDLEACKSLTPFLLVFTIHTISGAGMPSQWGPLHCLVTKIL